MIRLAARAVAKFLSLGRWLPDHLPPLDGYFYCSDFIQRLSRDISVGIAEHQVVHWGLPGVERMPVVPATRFDTAEPLTFLYTGQLLEHKGPCTLLQALSRCRRPHRLVVIGDDATDHGAHCKRVAARLGIAERVTFAGRMKHDEVLDHMARKGHVLVVPSRWDEPFSIVVLEGMGLGLPVVVSDTGGSPEAIRDGENGFLFPNGDVRALAAVLDRLESDRELCRQVGARARHDVVERYTLEKMVDAMLAAIGVEPVSARQPSRARETVAAA
jgi:glycosyltransferase involved in cell wall biosynthesis